MPSFFHLSKELAYWLFSSWRFLGTIFVIVCVALTAGVLPGSAADRVRYSGLALQLLGIFTVVHGLSGRRRLFKRPSLMESIRIWYGRRPRWRREGQHITVSGTASIGITGSADLLLWRGTPKDASLAEQVEVLRENIETLKAQQDKLTATLSETLHALEVALKSEKKVREGVTGDLAARMDALGAGGLHVEAVGLVWLTLGVILATVPTEVAAILRWLL